MIPQTDYPEKAQSMIDLIARLPLAVDRLEAALDGLTPDECARELIPGKWNVDQCVEHVALVSLGWTEIFYQAIEGAYPTPRDTDPDWKVPLEVEAMRSRADALAVYRAHNQRIADFLATLPASDFARGFKIVSFLTEPFQIKESINWGLVIHCDYHLATLHRLRGLLGKPLEWMTVYWERYPKP